MVDFKNIRSAKEARAVARLERSLNNFLNAPGSQQEYAYSPSTWAVGFRWQFWREAGPDHPLYPFRICNIHYPMFGRANEVTDWVSVGDTLPKRRKKARS